MSLDVLAQLCGERLIPHEIGDAEDPSERRRARAQKLTEKNVSEHTPKSDCGHTSSDEMSEDSRDVGSSGEDKLGSEGSGDGHHGDGDLKKQLRMIRNRQSAALSRKRKADRIDGLLGRVAELEEENRQLRRRCGDDAPATAPPSLHFAAAAAADEGRASAAGPLASGLQRATSSRSAADLLSLAHSMSHQTDEQHKARNGHSAHDFAPTAQAPPPLQACALLPPTVSPRVSHEHFFDAAAGDKALGHFPTPDCAAGPLSRATRIESSASDVSFA